MTDELDSHPRDPPSPTAVVPNNGDDNANAHREGLAETLRAEFEADSRYGFMYDGATDLLSALSVLVGVVVPFLVGFDVLNRIVVAAVSAFPVTVAALLKALRVVERGHWHWAKVLSRRVLYNRLVFSREPVKTVIEDYNRVLKEFPAFPSRHEIADAIAALSAVPKWTSASERGPAGDGPVSKAWSS